jgi:hypothetical protein
VEPSRLQAGLLGPWRARTSDRCSRARWSPRASRLACWARGARARRTGAAGPGGALAPPSSPAGPVAGPLSARAYRLACGNGARLGARRWTRAPNAAGSWSHSRRDLPARTRCLALHGGAARNGARNGQHHGTRNGARNGSENGARARMRKAPVRERGARVEARLLGPVARARVGGRKLGPWSARGGGASIGRESARNAARNGAERQRRTARMEARKGTARGANGRAGGRQSPRAPGASAAPFPRRSCWESGRARIGRGRARGKDAGARRMEGA